VAEVKLAAKIATDLGKPDGLVVVPPGGVAAFLAPLPVGRLWGVGGVTETALRRIGVTTIGDLARLPESAVGAALGADRARGLRALARGEDDREVVPDEAARSVGGEETFEEDLVGEAALARVLLLQASRVGRRLRAAGLRGRIVTLKVKYADFTMVTRRVTLPAPTDDDRLVYRTARDLLARIEAGRPVRLAGVTVSGFDEGEVEAGQLALFGAPAGAEPPPAAAARRQALHAALDKLADKYGERTVAPADLSERAVDERWPVHKRRDRE
jgi:DNA polymerase-4